MPQIAAIVLNWQQALLTQTTINSLLQAKLPPKTKLKIYLIDNHSLDNSFKVLKKIYQANKKIQIFRTQTNLGYAAGNNFGLKKALNNKNNQYFLISNNDLFFDQNFLSPLLKMATNSIVGPKIYFAPGYEFHRHRYQPKQIGKIIWSTGGQMDWNNILGSNINVDQFDHGQLDQSHSKLDFISGCCFLTTRSVLKKIGLFDPYYFMYLEDVDFCHRAKQQNINITYQPKSIIWHINSGSSSSGSQLHDYQITKNRLYFAHKFSPFKTRFALFREAIKFLAIGSPAKKKAVIDYYLHGQK